jgi:hypothetical protein
MIGDQLGFVKYILPDSFWFADDECGYVRKVWRIRGSLVGLAGDLDSIRAWREKLRANKTLPRVDVTALRLSTTGIDCWNNKDGWHHVDQHQFAIGTGGKAARAALMAGASCARAIRIVCDIDATTGGPVRTYRLSK